MLSDEKSNIFTEYTVKEKISKGIIKIIFRIETLSYSKKQSGRGES